MIKDNNKPKFSFIESETKNTDNNISEKPIEEINEIEYEKPKILIDTSKKIENKEISDWVNASSKISKDLLNSINELTNIYDMSYFGMLNILELGQYICKEILLSRLQKECESEDEKLSDEDKEKMYMSSLDNAKSCYETFINTLSK